MACINLTVTPVAPAVLGVTPVEGASMAVEPVAPAVLQVTPADGAAVAVTPAAPAVLSVTPQEGCTLTIGEVCSVTGGTIVVLAASDGPLRTRDGGYLLLNPATNPPEN
jgi:hypothetical protein